MWQGIILPDDYKKNLSLFFELDQDKEVEKHTKYLVWLANQTGEGLDFKLKWGERGLERILLYQDNKLLAAAVLSEDSSTYFKEIKSTSKGVNSFFEIRSVIQEYKKRLLSPPDEKSPQRYHNPGNPLYKPN